MSRLTNLEISEKEMRLLPRSKEGCCPNCGNFSTSDLDVVAYTPPGIQLGEESYSWWEKIKCPSCETIYRIPNGT